MIGTKPYAKLKYREVKGRQMAYIDEGEELPLIEANAFCKLCRDGV